MIAGELTIGGRPRRFTLRLPDGASGELPLVLVLHGNHPEATGAMMRQWTTFDEQAGAQGFAVAYPDGHGGCWADGRGVTTADEAGIDDVAFLRAVIDDVAGGLPASLGEVPHVATGRRLPLSVILGFEPRAARSVLESTDIVFRRGAPSGATIRGRHRGPDPGRPRSPGRLPGHPARPRPRPRLEPVAQLLPLTESYVRPGPVLLAACR